MGVSGEALQLQPVYKKPYLVLQVTYQYYKSHENPYQYYKSHLESVSVPQVAWKSVSGTVSQSERAMNEIEGSYDKIIITIVPSYTGKIVLVCCRWHL